MADINGIKIEPTINLPKIQLGKSGKKGNGGDGGEIVIITEEIKGNGQILAEGGDGNIAGKGGMIHIQAKKNNYKGKISVRGGNVK